MWYKSKVRVSVNKEMLFDSFELQKHHTQRERPRLLIREFSDYIPLIFIIIFIMPLVYELMRLIFEEALELDKRCPRFLIRVMEVFLAFILLPTATSIVVVILSWWVFSKLFSISFKIADFFIEFGVWSMLLYYMLQILIFNLLLVTLIIIMNLLYENV